MSRGALMNTHMYKDGTDAMAAHRQGNLAADSGWTSMTSNCTSGRPVPRFTSRWQSPVPTGTLRAVRAVLVMANRLSGNVEAMADSDPAVPQEPQSMDYGNDGSAMMARCAKQPHYARHPERWPNQSGREDLRRLHPLGHTGRYGPGDAVGG